MHIHITCVTSYCSLPSCAHTFGAEVLKRHPLPVPRPLRKIYSRSYVPNMQRCRLCCTSSKWSYIKRRHSMLRIVLWLYEYLLGPEYFSCSSFSNRDMLLLLLPARHHRHHLEISNLLRQMVNHRQTLLTRQVKTHMSLIGEPDCNADRLVIALTSMQGGVWVRCQFAPIQRVVGDATATTV